MESSYGQKSVAARECCCSCVGGSRREILEGDGGSTTGAEIKPGQGNAANQDGIPTQGMGCYNVRHFKEPINKNYQQNATETYD